ncbi:MAG: HAMP domain-containing histidine kinase [Myxococcales bacterium]|nr:HAMP domain-containing histidine kinase [Myxococcales bacterium]MBK7197201.1 HAMP domain-containing histidine kinase [Myxococcales bacterium]
MNEVSCRFFDVLIADLAARGVPTTRLVQGTAVPPAQLSDKDERIDWDTFLAIMANGATLWSPTEFERLGRRSVEGSRVRFIGVVARIRFTVRQFFHWVASEAGPGRQMITCTTTRSWDLPDGRLVIEVRIAGSRGNCPSWHHVTRGTFAAMPAMLGAPPATVELELLDDGARFVVAYKERTTWVARLRRRLDAPRTLAQAADELTEAHRTLLVRYRELEAARQQLAKQARGLSASSRIARLALDALTPDAASDAVCAALVDELAATSATIALGAAPPAPAATARRFELGTDRGVMGHLDVALAFDVELIPPLLPTIALVLQNAIDRAALAAYQQHLEQRVADRTAELVRARDELTATVTRLEEAQASREKLFHNISHEIRTPLSLVLLLVDGVLTHHRAELTERAVGQMNAITVSTRKLVRLVDELLLLASGQERNLVVRPEPIELAQALPELLAGWTLAAHEAGLALTVSVDAAGPVMADPAALERVLANLVSNAIKFTPRGGHVAVTVARHGDRAQLAVTDDGPGIDDGFRQRIFERFEQGEAGRRLRSGSGIGLSIARALVRAHGGDLEVEANPAGRGSRFAFTLPYADAAAAASVTPGRLRPSDYGIVPTVESTTSHPPGISHGHILIAEDDVALAEAIRHLLAEDYTVTLAHDGADALAAAGQRPPDLLITDIEMPGMDGLDLARQVQALPGEGATPVLVMSARAQLGDRLAGFDAGAVDYLVKPFDPAELRARVRAQLAYRGLAQRLYRTEKLAAMGALSAGLAHELRNPANGIVNAIAPLRELLPPAALDPETGVGELIDVIEQCAEQVAYVSRQLLGFRRSGDLDLRPTPLADVVSRAVSNASAALAEVELATDLAYAGTIRCAAPLLTQVMVNLLDNAAQAAGRGGWVRVASALEDGQVLILISDSGPGVPPGLQEKIFEPFFTTKPPGQGTGLGLATARDLITRHGGTLELRVRDGRSIFVIALPLPTEVRR